jgi:hypothetical protein
MQVSPDGGLAKEEDLQTVNSLAARPLVCWPKKKGGLCIKNLEIHYYIVRLQSMCPMRSIFRVNNELYVAWLCSRLRLRLKSNVQKIGRIDD